MLDLVHFEVFTLERILVPHPSLSQRFVSQAHIDNSRRVNDICTHFHCSKTYFTLAAMRSLMTWQRIEVTSLDVQSRMLFKCCVTRAVVRLGSKVFLNPCARTLGCSKSNQLIGSCTVAIYDFHHPIPTYKHATSHFSNSTKQRQFFHHPPDYSNHYINHSHKL